MGRPTACMHTGLAILCGGLMTWHLSWWLPWDTPSLTVVQVPKLRTEYELRFRWVERYEHSQTEPIGGFGGFVDAPPPPPKVSLLQAMLRKQARAARRRRSRRTELAGEASNASVCIVLTNFNNVMFINSTVIDLLVQTFRGQYMIVAVDDFSTDGSRTHLRTWGREEHELIPVLLPGRTMGGTGIPANVGIDVCRQRDPPFTYVAFADADDVVEPDFLAHLVRAGEDTRADVVIGDFDLWSRSDASAPKAKSEVEAWRALPKGVSLDPMQHFADMAALMPAPWRKMLRLDYVVQHNLRFPEGDFFYEDNVLHWQILLTARRVVLCPHVLVHHRSSRSLFGEHEIRNAGFFAVINAVGDELIRRPVSREQELLVHREFLTFIRRSRWITARQRNAKMRQKFESCFSRLYRHWLVVLLPSSLPSSSHLPWLAATLDASSGLNATNDSDSSLPRDDASSFSDLSFSTGLQPDDAKPPRMPLELSVVIPVYNAGPFIASLIARIDQISKVTYEVFCVNGASTDDSPQIISQLEETRSTMYNIQLLYQAPAGSLRNLVIPLLEGQYVFFLDADDSVDGLALESATRIALKSELDVLMLPYQLAFVSQHQDTEVTTLMGMDKYDHATWARMVALESSNATREAAMTLVNYPWNRLIRSELLLAHQVFFGTTQVQNDVQYHWHGLSVARRVMFLAADAAPVCYHKKFVGTARMQLTKVKSVSRLEMFWALQATHRALCQNVAKIEDGGKTTMRAWQAFVKKTIEWARNSKLVPAKSIPEFLREKARMLECAELCDMACLYAAWVDGSSSDEVVVLRHRLRG
eukprot:Transcript_21523.p1 GENE.Transcript_21523~~Transcript_21523.p1  ORF type:complete len:815 (+),score=122.61 Transcript_21523:197-2641(+)